MGMLPKGFGKNQTTSTTITKNGIPIECTVESCPICTRRFCRDKEHTICNECSLGMLWNGKEYVYYPGLDKSKQSKVGV